LWIACSCGFLIASWFVAVVVGLFVVSFDQDAVGKGRAGADECDELGCVDGTPPGLRVLDELDALAIPAARDPGPLVTR